MMRARVMRITRLTSHPHMGAELFHRVTAIVDARAFNPLGPNVWFGRQNVDDDRVVIVICSAWPDAEVLRTRFTDKYVGEPFGFEVFSDLVQSFEIEHYEHPGDEGD